MRLSRLTAPVVQEFVDRLLETRSRAMARRVLTSLKGVIGEAQRFAPQTFVGLLDASLSL